jgi:RNA polymerase sigma factor (sigma-70 family)
MCQPTSNKPLHAASQRPSSKLGGMRELPSDLARPDHTARRGFVTTRWSLVLDAGGGAASQARKALAELFELYWYPVYAFIRSQPYPAAEAEDLTQGFFARLLEKKDLALVEQGRGRFRNWLLVVVTSYLSNQQDYQRAEKRGGDRTRIELEDAEISSLAMSGLTPEQALERRWAVRLLENALIALGEECARAGKGALFARLKTSLTGTAEDSLKSIAEELGIKAGTVRIHAFRFRRRYQELIYQEVSRTVSDPAEAAHELRFLKSILKQP